jgi:glycerol-3-phosphate acyltransferase PlsY
MFRVDWYRELCDSALIPLTSMFHTMLTLHFLDYFLILLGYLAGSIPFGLLFTKAAGLGDIRNIGSGNIGATNVLRTGNKKLALATLIADGVKGAVMVGIASFMVKQEWLDVGTPVLVGLFAVIGHMFPVWLKFKGGKGVATTLAVMLALNLPFGVISCVSWLAVFALTKISSLSALVGISLGVLATFAIYGSSMMAYAFAIMALLVIIRHHANIRRLLKGEEPKSGKKK